MSLYAPNEDKPEFFRELFQKMEQYDGYRLIVGDFNVALQPELDRNTKNSCNPNATEFINTYMNNNNLVDMWRLRNPNRKHYSWQRKKPVQLASRIDLMLCDQAINSWFKFIAMKQSHKTDHLLVEGEVEINEVRKGPGLWKFNTKHLTNHRFIEFMNEKIDEQVQLAAKQKLNVTDTWEHLKLTMIFYAREFSSKMGRECLT